MNHSSNSSITRRRFLKTISQTSAALMLANSGLSCQQQRKPPNILFIMADDHTTNAISCYGSRLAKVAPTVNIDRIANEGMRFTNCCVTNSICTPSRAAIITGKYSHKNGVYTLSDTFDGTQPHVGKILGAQGYQTAMIGKWHLHSEPTGFDYWNVLPGQGRYFNPVLTNNLTGERTYEGHSTDVITDLSMQWLDQRDKSKPFFLMCHFKAPHERWEYPKRYTDYLKDVNIPEPESLWEDKSHRSEGSREYGFTIETMADRMSRPDYHSEGQFKSDGMDDRERKKAAYQIFLKRYLRTITAVDENVGRILKYLDSNNLADETVVMYTSDQGYFLGEHNYIDKRWMYEESLKMPLLVRYKKEVPAKTVNDAILINTDFAPTFLDFAGIDPPADMQGRSFRGILQGETPPDWRTAMYYRYWQHLNRPAHYGIRTKQYKLIFFYGLPLGMTGTIKQPSKVGWELYDLRKDPKELHNVYGKPEYADIVQQLKSKLLQLKKSLDDTDEKYPELQELAQKYWDR